MDVAPPDFLIRQVPRGVRDFANSARHVSGKVRGRTALQDPYLSDLSGTTAWAGDLDAWGAKIIFSKTKIVRPGKAAAEGRAGR